MHNCGFFFAQKTMEQTHMHTPTPSMPLSLCPTMTLSFTPTACSQTELSYFGYVTVTCPIQGRRHYPKTAQTRECQSIRGVTQTETKICYSLLNFDLTKHKNALFSRQDATLLCPGARVTSRHRSRCQIQFSATIHFFITCFHFHLQMSHNGIYCLTPGDATCKVDVDLATDLQTRGKAVFSIPSSIQKELNNHCSFL